MGPESIGGVRGPESMRGVRGGVHGRRTESRIVGLLSPWEEGRVHERWEEIGLDGDEDRE